MSNVLPSGLPTATRLAALVFLAVFLLVTAQPSAFAASKTQSRNDVQSELSQLKKERAELKNARKALESKLGSLNKELKKLDQSWVQAKRQLTNISKKKRRVDQKVHQLKKKTDTLKTAITTIQQRMQQEAATAWRRAGREPSWMDVLAGFSVTEIPHRRYMLATLMQQQEQDRQVLHQSMQDLVETERVLKEEQQLLASLRQKKKAAETKAKAKLQIKRGLARKVRTNVKLKKARDATLALQAAGLQNLLVRIQKQAEARKKAPRKKRATGKIRSAPSYTIKGHIRKHKGQVPWPLRGKVVARYGARIDKNRPKLKGVLIAPRNSREGRKARAIANGIVRYADWFGGFGLMIIVEHSDGIMSIYAHNDALYKKLGDRVTAGDVLSDAGSTGWVERVRLYFEMRDRGKVTNPERWCKK